MRTIIVMCFMFVLLVPSAGIGGIVFEDDFSADPGWSASCVGTISLNNTPSKWSGYKCQPDSSLDILSDQGIGETPALRIGYRITGSAGGMSLFKHLTDNENIGYDELYVRYVFKFDDDWKSGTDGSDIFYWKWIRLWQNIPVADQSQWSEIQNENTRYIVTNFSGRSGGKGCIASTWADNVPGHSAGGSRYMVWYDYENQSPNRGCFKNFSDGQLEIQQPGDPYPGYFVTYPSGSQSWHTIEYHFKLSTTQEGNGVFEVWFDGERQEVPTPYEASRSGGSMSYLNTMNYNGGMNLLTVFDNMAGWSAGWANTKYIYLDNVVVSTSYIGPESVPIGGDSQANVIPASQINQAMDGSGTVTINFKALDEFGGIITLNDFEYSTDNGNTWIAPANGDSSVAFSSNWADNQYFSGQYSVINGTTAEWNAAAANNFSLNVKHPDFAELNEFDGDVRFRFYVNNGNPTSSNDPAQTESINLDTLSPYKVNISVAN